MSRDAWECPRYVRRCTMEEPCSGCMADTSTYRRAVAIFCNAKHPSTDWHCDRQPHGGPIHRNMVLGETWIDRAPTGVAEAIASTQQPMRKVVTADGVRWEPIPESPF